MALKMVCVENNIPVKLDFSRYPRGAIIPEMLREGRYEHIPHEINPEHFPVDRTDSVDLNISLHAFRINVASDTPGIHLEHQGLQPIPLEYLIGLGNQYQALLKRFTIAGLGSTCALPAKKFAWNPPTLYAPYVCQTGIIRNIDLFNYHLGWPATYVFAAIPKAAR